MNTIQKVLSVDQIDFDQENPRIKASLEKYGDAIDDNRIRFALRSSMDDASPGRSSYSALKGSIRAAKGICVPITVYQKDDRYICIDGNTRLLIYHELAQEGAPGNWNSVKAEILQTPGKREIETVRITAHLVGAREWPAYEKARFLHELHTEHFMDHDQLIAICGGNKRQIQEQMDAYEDMNTYYREPNPDEAFKMDRFSGFVELQKRGIKESIFDAGLELNDFGDWIRDGQIFRLEDVRKLPRVLSDDEAREAFLEGDVRSVEIAAQIIDRKQEESSGQYRDKMRIGDANLGMLAKAMLEKIEHLPRHEFNALRDGVDVTAQDTVEALGALDIPLNRLLEDVRK